MSSRASDGLNTAAALLPPLPQCHGGATGARSGCSSRPEFFRPRQLSGDLKPAQPSTWSGNHHGPELPSRRPWTVWLPAPAVRSFPVSSKRSSAALPEMKEPPGTSRSQRLERRLFPRRLPSPYPSGRRRQCRQQVVQQREDQPRAGKQRLSKPCGTLLSHEEWPRRRAGGVARLRAAAANSGTGTAKAGRRTASGS